MTTITDNLKQNTEINSNQPEIDLLLKCAFSNLSQSDIGEIKLLLKNNIDWLYLIEICQKHKVLPLVFSKINKIDVNVIPNNIKRYVVTFVQTNSQRNLLLTAELVGILNLLKMDNINPIALKGPVLAKLAYENFGLRVVSDLDVFVEKPDFDKAQNLLVEHGYRPSELNKHEYYQQAQFYTPKTSICIDLHYDFSPKNHFASVDSDIFWKNTQTLTIAGKQIKTFSPEYQLIYLCLEGGKEYWCSLNRICDISGLIHTQNIDWELLLDTINYLNKEKVVFLGLFLIDTFSDALVPKFIKEQIDLSIKNKLSKNKICFYLFRSKFSLLSAIGWHLFNLQAYQGTDKLKYLYQIVKVNIKVKRKKFSKTLGKTLG